MTGDVIKAAVHGKYLDPTDDNYDQLIGDLIAAVLIGTTGPGTGGDSGPRGPGDFPFPGYPEKTGDDLGVQAYLNYLVFNKEGVLNEDLSGYKALSAGAKEDGTGKSHEELSHEFVITEPGFVYIYPETGSGQALSNDSPEPMDVFFDDFEVEHVHSAIVQVDDYYPFGLTFNSYQRENSIANKYLYNGKELQESLGLDWYDYGFRMYDPALGRWHVQDGHAEKYFSFSPYNYVVNNPINMIDLLGLDPIYRDGKYYETDDDGKEYEVDFAYVQGWMQENDAIAASYSFTSTESGTKISETKDGQTNTFTYNGKSYKANSMATLMGRDDRDNSIGAFSGVETLGGLEMENILGHATSIFYDMYRGNVELAVLQQSVGGLLDYKNKLYDILGINRNSLIEINGTTYNANEAGNFLWGMVIEYAGGLVSPNMIAELGTRGRNDESWEQKAITSGRNYALELLKRDDNFKRQILFQRVQFRAPNFKESLSQYIIPNYRLEVYKICYYSQKDHLPHNLQTNNKLLDND